MACERAKTTYTVLWPGYHWMLFICITLKYFYVCLGVSTCELAHVKVKFTLEQAMKAQKGSRCNAVPFL